MSESSVQRIREQLSKPRRIVTPSGFEFTVKRMTTLDYIKQGLTDIPNEFFQFVLSLHTGESGKMTPEQESKNYALFEQFLSVTLEVGVIDPPIILRFDKDKSETHIVWSELPPKDQEYLVGCITGRIDDEGLAKKEDKSPETPAQ